jgi:CheY-like chemotaxis protein
MIADKKKAIEILLVDDNAGDAHLLQDLLSGTKNPNNVHTARNGSAALSFLRKREGQNDAPTLDLIILDINMPKMNGIEVLKEMRDDPCLSHIPVIILSSSDDEADVRKCYDLHANCYLTKPITLDDLDRLVRSIDDFWLTSVRFPPN